MRQTFNEYMRSIAKGIRRYRGASVLDAINIYRLGLEDAPIADIRDGLIMDRLGIDANQLAERQSRKSNTVKREVVYLKKINYPPFKA